MAKEDLTEQPAASDLNFEITVGADTPLDVLRTPGTRSVTIELAQDEEWDPERREINSPAIWDRRREEATELITQFLADRSAKMKPRIDAAIEAVEQHLGPHRRASQQQPVHPLDELLLGERPRLQPAIRRTDRIITAGER